MKKVTHISKWIDTSQPADSEKRIMLIYSNEPMMELLKKNRQKRAVDKNNWKQYQDYSHIEKHYKFIEQWIE